MNGIKNVHTSRTRGNSHPLHGPQALGGKSILGGYLHSNAGVFSDRGVLGRQGRDTDASNGEVDAEDRCWDQLAALS